MMAKAQDTYEAKAAPVGREGVLAGAKPTPRRRMRPWTIRLISLAVVLTAWEVYGGVFLSPVVFTYPSAIARAFVHLTSTGELWAACRLSLSVLFIGWIFAVLTGIAAGLLMGRFSFVEKFADLYVNALYATPIVALVPLIINWFGFSVQARVVIVYLFSVFPVVINTFQGVKNVDAGLLEVAQAFCSNERQLWRDVVLPSALPYIVAGLRLSIGRGLVGLVVAELFTSISGLGAIIVDGQTDLANDRMFVPIIILMALGILLSESLRLFEEKLAPWRPRGEE